MTAVNFTTPTVLPQTAETAAFHKTKLHIVAANVAFLNFKAHAALISELISKIPMLCENDLKLILIFIRDYINIVIFNIGY